MSKGLFIASEELKVDQLFEAEKSANKTGEFDMLYQTVLQKNNDSAEKEASDETDTSSKDISDDPVSDEDTADDEVTQESFRNLRYELSTESFMDEYSSNGITEAIKKSFKYLGYLGITYGPGIASHTYRGVVYAMGSIIKLLFNSIVFLTKYINRHVNSFTKLKADIKDARSVLAELKNKKDISDLTNVKYNNTKVINTLKAGDSLDLIKNIKSLSHFINTTISQIDISIKNDIGSIKHIVARSSFGTIQAPINIMKVNCLNDVLFKGSVRGFDEGGDLVESYVSKQLLPGDVVLMAKLPIEDVNSLEDITKAYNSSSMFLGINADSFKSVDTIDYMTVDVLSNFLDSLERLCDLCITHQSLYENIKKQKTGLRYNFKNYFSAIVSSTNKISLGNSLIEYIYLKSIFIDKVYLAAAVDVHDYAVRVITSGLSFTKSNISKL